MKKRLFLIVSFLVLVSIPLIALAPVASAASCNGVETSVDFQCDKWNTDGISAILLYVINFMAVGVGIAVVIGIIFGGITYAMSDGEESKAKEGREIITNSVIGLFLFIFLYAGMNFFIPGGVFNLNAKPAVVASDTSNGTSGSTGYKSNGVSGSGSAKSPTTLKYSTLVKLKDCSSEQALTSDGTYLYLACIKSESSRPTQIRKLTLSGKEVKRSDTYYESTIGHANDAAYNPKTNTLIINGWVEDNDGNKKLLFFDPDTLKLQKTASFNNGPGGGNLCYNSTTNQYFSMSRGSGSSDGGYVYDSSFTVVKKLISKQQILNDLGEEMVTGQGVDCTQPYIYIVNSPTGWATSRILVYDWNAKVVGVYEVKGELEGVTVANGTLYGVINGTDTVIKITNVPV